MKPRLMVQLFPHWESSDFVADGTQSNHLNIRNGLPQWSILGPLLFTSYISNILPNQCVNVYFFADDTILYSRLHPSSGSDSSSLYLGHLFLDCGDILYCHAAPVSLQLLNPVCHSAFCFIPNDKSTHPDFIHCITELDGPPYSQE